MDQDPPVIPFDEGWREIQSKAILPLEVYVIYLVVSQKSPWPSFLINCNLIYQAMLEDGLKGAKAGISRKDYATAYTACYNMCTQRSPFNWSEQLYERHGEVCTLWCIHVIINILRLYTFHNNLFFDSFIGFMLSFSALQLI